MYWQIEQTQHGEETWLVFNYFTLVQNSDTLLWEMTIDGAEARTLTDFLIYYVNHYRL